MAQTPMTDWYNIREQAIEMEKEQIAEAYRTGVEEDVYNNPLKTGEDYYEDTYSHPDPSDDEIYNNFNHEGGIKY